MILLTLLTVAFGSVAESSAAAIPERLVAEVAVTFTGSSTLHDFSGQAPPLTG